MLGLGKVFSYDIQRYVSNDQVYGKLSGSKDWQKHLSNFPTVTLRSLCWYYNTTMLTSEGVTSVVCAAAFEESEAGIKVNTLVDKDIFRRNKIRG
jgi:hypothetical protein